ncbi:hypothetical protein B0H13DRAFT_2332471 [Mycena leptocephala]|nr:hypothetical protein B0H13DRAFT_2332471 [Mycena leptocephala]
MHTVHQLASTLNVIVFMGSCKLAAAEEGLAKFALDVHSSSTVVPVQLDITDDASIKNAHTFIAKHLQDKNTLNRLLTIRPLLKDGGAILNISSDLASLHSYTQRPPPPIFAAYSSSKAALNSLTLQWAIQELEKRSGIRVASINPGMRLIQHDTFNLNNYAGTMDPAEGCKVIVNAALQKEGRSGVFFDKDGDVAW